MLLDVLNITHYSTCIVQDLLTTVNTPEWPAAELLLSVLGHLLVNKFANKGKQKNLYRTLHCSQQRTSINQLNCSAFFENCLVYHSYHTVLLSFFARVKTALLLKVYATLIPVRSISALFLLSKVINVSSFSLLKVTGSLFKLHGS